MNQKTDVDAAPLHGIVSTRMSDNEAIEAVKAGRRCVTDTTLDRDWKPESECGYNHSWRAVACNGEQDVVECSRCGTQRIARCNFDDDFA